MSNCIQTESVTEEISRRFYELRNRYDMVSSAERELAGYKDRMEKAKEKHAAAVQKFKQAEQETADFMAVVSNKYTTADDWKNQLQIIPETPTDEV